MTDVELIKEKLDIADVLRAYIQLLPAGKNLKALCPFHKEKTPSFIVSPDRQSWHCFGCNSGGDMISFVEKYENIEFFEALKILADKAGVDLRRVGGPDQKQYAALYEANAAARDFFKEQLKAETAVAGAAREYLTSRGLTQATVDEFELGFAANASDALNRHLLKLGFSVADIERAGLAFKTERGTLWDRFRNRIMFPLHNSFGKVIAFTGRILDSANPELVEGRAVAKYINSPETPIFSKSKLIYGFDKSKNAIREAKAAVLVEGQMDLVMSWQDGIKHVIATSGTALTAEHLKPLRRIAETLIVSFDNDEAGQVAIERTIDLASAHDFAVTVADTRAAGEGFKDPADIAQAKPGLLKEIMARARPAMEFYFDRYLKRADDMASRKRNLRTVLQKIKVIASPVEQAHWVQQLSRRSGISETALLDEMRTLKVEVRASDFSPAQGAAAEPERAATRHDRIAEALLAVAIAHPALAPELAAARDLFPAFYQPFIPASGAPWSGEVPADVTLRSSLVTEDAVAAKAEFSALLRELRRERYRIEREVIQGRIREAEASGNETMLADALREFDKCSREMHTM